MATTYIVLRKSGDGPSGPWAIIGHEVAHGPMAAARKVGGSSGEYLAVPIRNATFVMLGVEQPPPRVTSAEVNAEAYLDVQETLPSIAPVEDEVGDAA